jgi:hypothetical protein
MPLLFISMTLTEFQCENEKLAEKSFVRKFIVAGRKDEAPCYAFLLVKLFEQKVLNTQCKESNPFLFLYSNQKSFTLFFIQNKVNNNVLFKQNAK